jgi:Ca2+:H+ antiporter
MSRRTNRAGSTIRNDHPIAPEEPPISSYTGEPSPIALVRTHSQPRFPLVFGRKPVASRISNTPQSHAEIDHIPAFPLIANLAWSILIGWWCSFFVFLSGLILILTVIGFDHGCQLLQLSGFILFPFGKRIISIENDKIPIFKKLIIWIILSIFFVIPLSVGAAISWELLFFLPMARFLFRFIKLIMFNLPKLTICPDSTMSSLESLSGQESPLNPVNYAGSFKYFGYEIYEMDVIYLNFFPLCLISLYIGYIAPNDSPLKQPIVGTLISIISTIPCMYVIGVCTEVLSGRCGLVLGSVINAVLTGFVELILLSLTLRQGLSKVVQASVTGAFLMNLLVIPGLSIISGGLKSKEVKIDKNVQTVSGTFMFMVIVGVFFPTVLYKLYSRDNVFCRRCESPDAFLSGMISYVNCSQCDATGLLNLDDDPAYTKMGRPFVFVVAAFLPLMYIVAIFFSLKTHRYLWEKVEEELEDENESAKPLPTVACIVLLIINCTMFSVVCEILTDSIGEAIEQMHLTPRFVGLVFFTLIPSVAEFINAVRFAWDGHIGLSLEIGNQGAMVVSLLQMPALVLISELISKHFGVARFNLIFDAIDVYAIIIAVLLRNMMLMEKSSVNYLTGFAFLVIFFFIGVVYFYLED